MEVCRYYQLTETGFYYLQSRYYDPTLGRFLNADSYASTGQGFLGFNMFAYCGNNSVNLNDFCGCYYVINGDEDEDGVTDYLEEKRARLNAINHAFKMGKRAKISYGEISFDFDSEYAEYCRIEKCLGEQTTCEIITSSACVKYYNEIGEYFLLSDSCVAYEYYEHVEAYRWAVGDRFLPNDIALGFSFLRGGYNSDSVYNATKSIDIRYSDITAGNLQAFAFSYRMGIRDCYIGTDRDPWRDSR